MIEFIEVSKSYGRVAALRGVSLRIEAGDRVAFVGTNGSGKTTLLRALLGLVQVGGEVRVGGVSVSRQPAVALAAMAYVPQVAPPLDAPVGEVVRACEQLRRLPPLAVARWSERFGLDLEALRATRFRDLSGGMKQKLLAALALAAETPILVGDEPTANLDPAARATFFEALRERPGGSIVVVCSHRVEEVRGLVSRVIELRDGSVVRDERLDDAVTSLPRAS